MTPSEEAGVYVHIPFCLSRCRYCAFVSSIYDAANVERYVSAIKTEINLYKNLQTLTPCNTVYFGGGTPSLLSAAHIENLLAALIEAFGGNVNEVSVECNPDTVDGGKLRAFKEAGVTRTSFGVQSLDDNCLSALNRRHDAATALLCVEQAAKVGLKVGADLMIGLAGQTCRDVTDAVRRLSDVGATHLSLYSLTLEEDTPLYDDVMRGETVLPDEDACADMYEAAVAACAKAGLKRYEVSNFARKGYECAHNLKYWKCGQYYGLGLAAHSLIGDTRYFNSSEFGEYYAALAHGVLPRFVEERLTPESKLSERLMLGLRLDDGIDVRGIEEEFGIAFAEKYAAPLAKHARFLNFDGKRLALRPYAMEFMNSILIDFI